MVDYCSQSLSGRLGLNNISTNRLRRPLWAVGAAVWAFIWAFSVVPAQAQDAQSVYAAPQVEVIGVAPLHGTGVAREKVPANVKTLSGRQLDDTGGLNVGTALQRAFGSVTVNDAQNNPFQRDINVRGYVASPLLGNAQGLAVYMNGSRINEGFGEEVQWDLMPDFAVDQVQLIPGANPVYGLNALGGSLSLKMKNGFDNPGARISFSGGSFSRFAKTLEYGTSVGRYAAYIGISRHEENGWRDFSPSELTKIFSDVRYQGDRFAASVSANLASTDLNGNGASPIGLLAIDRAAVFTHPDNTRNRLAHIVVNASYDVNASTTLEGAAYYRLMERKTLNGDEFEGDKCEELIESVQGNADDGNGLPGFDKNDVTTVYSAFDDGFLCAEIEEDDIEEFETEAQAAQAIANAVLLKTDGTPVDSGSDTGGEEASAAFNRSETITNSLGGSLQVSFDRPVWGYENLLIAGTSVDHSSTDYNNSTQIGELNATRSVDPFEPSVFLSTTNGQANLNSFRSRIKGKTTSAGVYFSDSLDLTDALTATLAGRFNWSEVVVEDRFARSKDNHTYNRFNPSVGLTYQFDHRLGLFANYSEANRAPSPVELSCADPANPCRVPNAFLADPPLEQVVNRSIELGARGTGLHRDLTYAWTLTGFAGRNYDDILFTQAPPESPVGLGYFRNAGTTQRMGAEVDFNARWQQLGFSASYSYIDATFRSAVDFPRRELTNAAGQEVAGFNEANDAKKGDRLPGIPKHNLRLGLDYFVTNEWTIGLDGVVASDQVLRGDEANQAPKVKGYGIMHMRSSYSVSDKIELFVLVENVFDADYNTFGLIGENPHKVIRNGSGAAYANRVGRDNRFLGPGAPRGVWGGFRIGF